MGSCQSIYRRIIAKQRKMTILTIGLDNAGKTCAVHNLLNESVENVAPTVGFSKSSFKQGKNSVTIYDLGGGQSIRGIWKNYFAEVHGIVFVIDSSASHRMQECKQSLTSLLDNPMVSGKPMLILANKQDCEAALDEIAICDILDLEHLVNSTKTPTRVETCSTVKMGNKQDKIIKQGFKWLINVIAMNWDSLSIRVERDLQEQKQIEEKLRLERVERVRKMREQQEQQEKIDAAAADNSQPDVTEEEQTKTNPFKPINEITAKLESTEKVTKEAVELNTTNTVEKSIRMSTKSNGMIVNDPVHDEIVELTSQHDVMSNGTNQSASSSRIHSPTSRVIQVTPKNSDNESTVALEKMSNKWTPYVNENNLDQSIVSLRSPDYDGNVTTVVAQIERESSDIVKDIDPVPAIQPQNSLARISTPSGLSSQENSSSSSSKSKKKRNKLQRNKIIPVQTSTDESVDGSTKLPPLKVHSHNSRQISLPALSSFEVTKSSSDSDGRIQWELAENLQNGS